MRYRCPHRGEIHRGGADDAINRKGLGRPCLSPRNGPALRDADCVVFQWRIL